MFYSNVNKSSYYVNEKFFNFIWIINNFFKDGKQQRYIAWKNSKASESRDGKYTSKKVYYVQYTDTDRFLLKIYNMHVLWEI